MNLFRMIVQLVPDTSLGAVAVVSKDGDKTFKIERGERAIRFDISAF